MAGTIGWVLALLGVVILVANRERIGAWFDHQEARQQARLARIANLRRHPHGHMALTIDHIASQTPPVDRIWVPRDGGRPPVPRFVWDGTAYETRDDAEDARTRSILEAARAFYVDLDGRQSDTPWMTKPGAPPTPRS
ncbi:MAG: hypothetical protein ACFB6R_10880 [Alphaproteobacteria bacterium]